MKICPNCGSVLADNEPYCENCGFDPDFDMGSWDYGGHSSSSKPYIHGDHIKSSKNSENDDGDLCVGILFLGALAGCGFFYLEANNWNIGYVIESNIESIFLIIIVIAVFMIACNYFNKL